MATQGPLTVAVACHAWRVHRAGRLDCFRETLRSLGDGGYPHTRHLHTVGLSADDDGTHELVRQHGGTVFDEPNSAGRAMNRGVELALRDAPYLILLSADDYAYSPGWLARLVSFWAAAPPEVALVSCNLEPDYDWNTVRGVVDAGGLRALVRDSAGGSNWSFRTADWPVIGPLPEITGGEDLSTCRRLIDSGRTICQVDLAEHCGERASAWSNLSWTYARPLNRQQWGI